MNERTCRIDGCSGRLFARKWCRTHYKRWHKYGDPLTQVTVPARQSSKCQVTGCSRRPVAKNLCSMHYQRQKKDGEVGDASPLTGDRYRACKVPACDRPHYGSGFCGLHHRRWKKHGDPNVNAARPKHQPILRADGYVWVWMPEHPKAHMGRVPEHRVVMEQQLDRGLLQSENVHHINGDRQDNRLENLELWVTHQPKGQRPEDLVAWAREIIHRYG